MKISYVTIYDAADIHKWSGAGFYISKALERQNSDLHYIGNIHISLTRKEICKKIFYKAINKKYDFHRTIYFAKHFAELATPRIRHDSNIIFSPGSIPLALLNSKIPKVFYTDATFAGLIDFYENYTNLSREIIEQGHYLEKQALDNSSMAIYSSEWAARSAIEVYNADPGKIKIVPFGANIESNRDYNDIKDIVSKRSRNECNLLFIGVDWLRKGGELAVKIATELNRRGINTKLHVVGIRDHIPKKLPDFVINHGFISKSTEAGKMKLNKLFAESHFLVVPSKAEAFGIVFCEAASFGLPSLSTDVGGITTPIVNDISGRTFSLKNGEIEYADYILSKILNFQEYENLAYSSFNEYETRLNWGVAGKSILKLLKTL
jgi:glycosyltransferase involved in cell wall biosynthesis